MRILVPFDARNPKTRLSSHLDDDERTAFARAMLEDVLAAIRGYGGEPTVLSTAPIDCDAPVTVSERPLTPAVNEALSNGPMAVLMADLPLVTPNAIERLVAPSDPVVMAPGMGGGTNALVVRSDEFHVDFHGISAADHRQIAAGAGLSMETVDSFQLALDVDEPADLAEVLLHGSGRAAAWLRDAGFDLDPGTGRVGVERAE